MRRTFVRRLAVCLLAGLLAATVTNIRAAGYLYGGRGISTTFRIE